MPFVEQGLIDVAGGKMSRPATSLAFSTSAHLRLLLVGAALCLGTLRGMYAVRIPHMKARRQYYFITSPRAPQIICKWARIQIGAVSIRTSTSDEYRVIQSAAAAKSSRSGARFERFCEPPD
jgi:hypothetical protein